MSKILVMGFTILLYFNIVGTLVCHYCRNVKPDNTCEPKETTCRTAPMNYCFTQIISKEFSIQRVRRGCSRACYSIRFKKYRLERERLCCTKDRCNDHDIWVAKK
ncbi:three-finger toxin 3FTx-Oxy6-like [Sceloporus undulatus]|uniref:three-finger toxin 3FTx-Oxy6-like n=1 Tax=Sceloporus undulatus TaxID=8520 RepID=UPI001C4AC947|nr:three-finger toxin 3FTx-Oxy6-like [Sceloporus undulatus]